jgi:integrase/recombinase XerD
LDTKDGYLRINLGKGKKDRVVPLGKIACQYAENYIQHVRPLLLKKDPTNSHLFLSLIGNKMSKPVVAHLVTKYVKESGVKKHVSPHTFRHTCATVLLKNKANIRYVQELLGHESIETTTIYTHLTITDLKEVHKRCHPRERDNR